MRRRRDSYTVCVTDKDFDVLRGLLATEVDSKVCIDVAVYDPTHGACDGQLWAVVTFDGLVRSFALTNHPFFASRVVRPTSRVEEFLWKKMFTRVL